MIYFQQDSFDRPLPFKALGRRPVKGGRWSVRRFRWVEPKPWRAWTLGKAQRFNRRFETQQEAVAHATMVAQAFADPTPERIEALIRRVYPWFGDDAVRGYVQRYAKFPKPRHGRR